MGVTELQPTNRYLRSMKGAGASNDNQPDSAVHRIRWEFVGKLKKSHRHLGNKGGAAVAGANNNYFFLVINLYNNNNHFVIECTALNRYETYPTTGFVLLTLDHTHSQVPRPTPSRLYIFMESPPREETKYE